MTVWAFAHVVVVGALLMSVANASPTTPASRDKKVLDAQLLAIGGKDRGVAPLAATFDANAVSERC